MAVSIYFNRIKYTPTLGGTGDFVTSAAVTGFRTPATGSIPDGSIVSYVAFSSDQTQWETGQGAYTVATTTLARTTVRESSNAGAKVNFTVAPVVALDFQAQDITNLPPIAVNGATIGSNALAVTGTAVITGNTNTSFAGVNILNTSNGNAAIAMVAVTNDLGATGAFNIQAIGSGYSSSGITLANSARLRTSSGLTGGLVFSTGTTTPMIFATNDTEAVRIDSSGNIIGATGKYWGWGASATADTVVSRQAAGVTQFGTTTANAAGSWLATNGTASGTLTAGASTNGVTLFNGNIYFPISAGPTYSAWILGNTGSSSASFQFGSGGNISWNSAVSMNSGSIDATLSRNAAGILQFGTTANNAAGAWLAAKGTLTGGTLADQTQVFAITATQPASPTASQSAITATITGAGSANQLNEALVVTYASGYTGSNYALAIHAINNSASVGTGAMNAGTGNYGVFGASGTITVGHNIGVAGVASAAVVNIGTVGHALVNKNSGTNIGVLGNGLNGGTSPVQIGGFFSLNQTTVPTVSAALIADNGAQTDAIFLARDNGTTVFTIADGGAVTSTVSFNVGITSISSGVIKTSNINNSDNTNTIFTMSNSSGNVTFSDTATPLFRFSGTTSSFPAIKRSTTVLQFKLADDSAFTSFTATTGILNALASDAGQTTATVCAENTTGQLYKGSGTIGICLGTSSARYKNRITDATDGLAELVRLAPKRFWYNKNAGDNGVKEQVGFSAEDVVKVLPGLVGLDAKGRPNTLDMVGMIPIIVKAVQELKADNSDKEQMLVIAVQAIQEQQVQIEELRATSA